MNDSFETNKVLITFLVSKLTNKVLITFLRAVVSNLYVQRFQM